MDNRIKLLLKLSVKSKITYCDLAFLLCLVRSFGFQGPNEQKHISGS